MKNLRGLTLLLIISSILINTDAFNAPCRSTLNVASHTHAHSRKTTTLNMMLPGRYKFVLKEPSKKRSTMLDAGNSRTDLIQAEGSGSPCRIKVIGVGGGGGNAVNRMIESSTGVAGVELWVVNTDAQALSRSLAPRKLNIGNLTSRYDGATICFLVKF